MKSWLTRIHTSLGIFRGFSSVLAPSTIRKLTFDFSWWNITQSLCYTLTNCSRDIRLFPGIIPIFSHYSSQETFQNSSHHSHNMWFTTRVTAHDTFDQLLAAVRSGLSLGAGNVKDPFYKKSWISHSLCLCKWIPKTHKRHPKITTASEAAHKYRVGLWWETMLTCRTNVIFVICFNIQTYCNSVIKDQESINIKFINCYIEENLYSQWTSVYSCSYSVSLISNKLWNGRGDL